MEVKRSEVEFWGVRAGPAESGWGETHPPTEVTTRVTKRNI